MPEQFKHYIVYGPYQGPDGRYRVILYSGHQKQTMSYPKYMWWRDKGILIKDHEQIHHKDENFTNNVIENFEVRTKYDHMSLHVNPSETYNCQWCEKNLELSGIKLSRYKTDKKRNKNGPFCSKQCSGQYGAYIMYVIQGKQSKGGRKPYKLKNLANKLYQMRQINAP